MKTATTKCCVAALGLSLAFAGGAHADSVIFSDNFDGESVGGNLTSLDNWDVTSGNVDVLGPGFWDLQPGNGKYLDMDGMGLGTISLRGGIDLGPGNYELSFDLAGNQRNGNQDSVDVSLGALISESFSLASNAGFQTITRQFTVSSQSNYDLTFAARGVVDHAGMLLDDVLIRMIGNDGNGTAPPPPSVSTVPTPAAATAGLALLGFLAARRRRSQN